MAIFYYSVHACMRARAHLWWACEGHQRVSLSSMWVPEPNCGVRLGSKHLYLLSHLSRPFPSLLDPLGNSDGTGSTWCGRPCAGSGPVLYPHRALCRKESFFTAFWTSPKIFWLNDLGHMLTPIDIQGLGQEEKVEIKCTPCLKPSKPSWELEEQCGGRVDKWMNYQTGRMPWERMLSRRQTVFLTLSQ